MSERSIQKFKEYIQKLNPIDDIIFRTIDNMIDWIKNTWDTVKGVLFRKKYESNTALYIGWTLIWYLSFYFTQTKYLY